MIDMSRVTSEEVVERRRGGRKGQHENRWYDMSRLDTAYWGEERGSNRDQFMPQCTCCSCYSSSLEQEGSLKDIVSIVDV